MQLGFLPRMRVHHTASHEKGQIYIPHPRGELAAGAAGAVDPLRKHSGEPKLVTRMCHELVLPFRNERTESFHLALRTDLPWDRFLHGPRPKPTSVPEEISQMIRQLCRQLWQLMTQRLLKMRRTRMQTAHACQVSTSAVLGET